MSDIPATRARLQLFGNPRLVDARGRDFALPVRGYILALFIITAGRDLEVSRSQLAGFLWPEAPSATANLRQLLARLRAAQDRAGIDFIRFDRAKVWLDLDGVTVDLRDFHPAIRGLSWVNCRNVIEDFRGELLEGISAPESDLSTWLDVHRSQVRESFVAAFADLLECSDARANPRTAQVIASRLLEIDPYQESAYRALMRSFAASGLLELVVATFEKCRLAIEADLGFVPSQATTDLLKALTNGEPAVFATSRTAAESYPKAGDALLASAFPRLVILPPQREGHDALVWDLASLVLEDTTIGLCSLKTIQVLAPHTSWALSGGKFDDEAASRFNVGYVVETAIRRRGESHTLSAKLFDTKTRCIIRADTYPLATSNLYGSHRALSAIIVLSLADAVEKSEIARTEREANPQAYYWHLIGQKHLRFMDLPNVRRALKAFRSAMAADPGFAPAFSGSARATQRQWLVLGRGDPELLEQAEQIGARAVSLDHRDARGYREIALCNLYRRRWDDAVATFSEAERIGPQHADLISDFGDTLGHCGEPEKGLEKVKKAMELNPIPPDQYWWNAAGLHFQLRDYEAAIEVIDRMGDPLPALRIAAAAWAYLGKKTEAQQCASRFLRSYPDFRIAHWLSIVPDKNTDDQRHYEVGLKMAGFR